jgi:hypothetical protein
MDTSSTEHVNGSTEPSNGSTEHIHGSTATVSGIERRERLQSPPPLPEGSGVEQLVFQPQPANGQPPESEFDEASHYLHAQDGEVKDGKGLLLLLVPLMSPDCAEVMAQARAWVENAAGDSCIRPLVLTLQGVQVVWSPGRAALLAPGDRIGQVRKAVIEFAFHEHELREIEQGIGRGWPGLESDSALAFDFHEKAIGRRADLAKRLQQTIALRARLARVTPYLCLPAIYPPTLAAQIGERLRERTRAEHRLDFVDRQLDVFERVYEMCSTRSSDFMHARKEHMLEIIIILFLATEVLLQLIAMMMGSGA